jgi:hypothetical protein
MNAIEVRRVEKRSLRRRSESMASTISFVVLLAAFSPAFGGELYYLPSLFPTGAYPSWSIVADNSSNPNSSVVTDATATVVTDPGLSIYNSADWYDASGTTVALPSGTLTAGEADVPWGGPIDIEADQWLLVTATFDGVLAISAYDIDDPKERFYITTQKDPTGKNNAGDNQWCVSGTTAPKLSNVDSSASSSTSPANGEDPTGNWSICYPAAGVYPADFTTKQALGKLGWNFQNLKGGGIDPKPTPEPSTFAAVGIGTVGLLCFYWRRREVKA